jgi:hypothetical protein
MTLLCALLPVTTTYLEFECYITTDGQSARLSWNNAPSWGLRIDFITARQLQVS